MYKLLPAEAPLTHGHLKMCFARYDSRNWRETLGRFTAILILGHNLKHKCEDKLINRLTPNDPHMGRTAPLTSKR